MLTNYEEITIALRLQGELNASHIGFDHARVIASTGIARLITQCGTEIVAWRLVSLQQEEK
jgi:hypothetical protein